MDDKKRALVADDMAEKRSAIKTFLFFCHFDCVEAEDGLKAKAALETGGFDLVVSDIEMPNMNGFELLTWIRKNPKLDKTPVIMLSSLESPETIERCKRLGANAYIVKPFTKEKMDQALGLCGLGA